MNKTWFNGDWFIDAPSGSIRHVEAGEYEDYKRFEHEDCDIIIDRRDINTLIDFLFKNGYIKPQLGENRTEDIKLINRLIDVIEK